MKDAGAVPGNAQLEQAYAGGMLSSLPLPLEMIAGKREARRETHMVKLRCVSTALPAGSLAEACTIEGTRILVATPELCFVLMAAQLGEWELAAFGHELCGDFWDDGGRPRKRAPLSTPARLQAYAAAAEGVTGSKRARRIARHLAQSASSPEQAQVAMLACLPRSLGGMGCKTPQLNARIEAPDVVARLIGSRDIAPDLYWPDAGIALEFDNRKGHGSATFDDLGARKRNAYRMMGIGLETLDAQQILDLQSVQETFDRINRACKVRLRAANPKQIERQKALLAWIAKKA